MVTDLYKSQRELWLYFVRKYQIQTGEHPDNETWVTQRIVEHLVLDFPTIDDDSVDSFLECLDGLYYFNLSQRREDRKSRIVQQLAPFFEDVKNTFKVKTSNLDTFNTFMKKIHDQTNHHAWVAIIGTLTEASSDLFEIPIVSPRGLWLTIHWPILQNLDQRGRLSWYNVDCLLVYTLTTSSWYQAANLNGWVCHNPYEVMVHHPEKYGKIRRIVDTYVDSDCQYEYEEM